MPRKKQINNIEQFSEVRPFSGSAPSPIGVGSTNESYTSADGLRIYLNFSDVDSSGLFPFSGIEKRFNITKITGGSAVTINPDSFYVDSSLPKTAQLILSSANAIIDSLYDGSGNATTAQTVNVTYTNSTSGGFGTIPLLSDNDNVKSFVSSFTGLGISNRTEESNPPIPLYAYTSADGSTVYVVFREASYPLQPFTGIGGFSVVQGNNSKTILNSRILDPTNVNNSKVVALDLSAPIRVTNEGDVLVSYLNPTSASTRLRDSTTRVNETSSFSGLAATNNVSEIVNPKIVSAYTSIGDPQKIHLKMSEPTLPGSSATGFSFFDNDSLLQISSVSVGNTTYAGNGVSVYSFTFAQSFTPISTLTLDYQKPSTNYITDQSNNLNILESFENRLIIENLYDDLNLDGNSEITDAIIGVDFSTLEGKSYVDTNGLDIYVYLNINRNYSILPLTGINGFNVFVDGQIYPIKSVSALNVNEIPHIKIILHNRIYEGSEVKIAYHDGNLTDHNSISFANFEPTEISNNSFLHRNELFDIFKWHDNTENIFSYDYSLDDNASELFRKSAFNLNSSVLIDSEPPSGIAIINRSTEEYQTGIKIHTFKAYGLRVEETGSAIDFDLTAKSFAWKVNLENDTTISELFLKLKYTNSILNVNDKIRIDLYTNSNDDKPGALISSVGTIQFSELETSYQDLSVSFLNSITLSKNTNYWFVIYCDSIVPSNISFVPIINLSYHISSSNFIAESSDDTTSGWLVTESYAPYYRFFANSNIDVELDSKDYILDIFEKPIREAEYYSSDTQYDKFELIGDKQSNYLIKRLTKAYEDPDNFDNDIYPKVSKIELGLSSNKPKNYVIEVRSSPNSKWVKLFDTLVDETTLDNLIYNFDIPIELSDLRIVYKGDYFTIDSTADLTIVANDKYTEVKKAQISHFEDFRDANSFENADEIGFISFSEGMTEYKNWNLTNNNLVFKPNIGTSSSEILTSISFGNKILIASNNTVYSFYNDEVRPISNETIIEENYQITCFASFKNKVYLGTSNGLVFSSSTGDYWTVVNGINPYDIVNRTFKTIDPITSMSVMGDKLYIGTKKLNNSAPTLYFYDGRSLKKFKEFDSTFNQISCMTSANFNLFVGLGGIYGSALSSIYSYDGLDWEETLSSEFDNVEAISYSTARNSIVVAFRGGDVWELPFVNNLPSNWSKIYDTNADLTFSINDDKTGKYLFICCDNKAVIYVKSTNTFKVITPYKSTNSGVNLIHRTYALSTSTYSEDLSVLEDYNLQKYESLTDGLNYDEFPSIGISSIYQPYQNLKLTGYFKAENTGDYKFKLLSHLPSLITIGGVAVTSSYSSIGSTISTTIESNRTWSLNKNDLLEFEIDSYDTVSTGSTQYREFKLYWNNVTGIDGYQVIPKENLIRPSLIKNILLFNSKYYGIGADGKIYDFDADFYETKLRNVYVRFQDEAGNLHGIILPNKTEAAEILTDKITQDLNVVDSTYQTKGKIYQIQKNDDNTLVTKAIYTPASRLYPIYAPNRKVKEFGYYETQPIFVPTLVKWGKITNLIANKYAINSYNGVDIEGLDAGTAVKVFVRTGNSRADCLNSSWSSAYEISYINDNSPIPPIETQEINIENYNGKWLQYKFELISATRNLSPEILSTTITYTAGTASYYFTKVFDTSDYDSSAPVIRRGVLTSNELLNNGTISYGYLNSDDPADVYDFNKYKEISPNKMFEIESPTSKIKFGILFTSVGSNPSVVYDFAIQLDIGEKNIKFMPSL